jgi:hypothetical protein
LSKIDGAKKERKTSSVNFIIILILLVIAITIALVKFINPAVASITVDKWYGGAKGAYTIIHDDLGLEDCYGIIENADSIAFNRGVKFGTGVVVGELNDSILGRVKTLVQHGHEIFPHSWKHGSAVDLGWTPQNWNNDSDIVLTKKFLEDSLNVEVGFFIFPFDAYSDENLEALKTAGYLGARAGKKMYEDRGVNSGNTEFDPYRSEFDAYMSQAGQDSITADGEDYFVSIYDDDKGSVAIQHLNASIEKGGWGVQELHNVSDVEPLGWGSVTLDAYRELLDHAVAKVKENLLWLETPSAVAKYIVTRNSIGAPVFKAGFLKFTSAPDEKYLTPITLTMNTKNSPTSVDLILDGEVITSEKIGNNSFRFELIPTDGEYGVKLNK